MSAPARLKETERVVQGPGPGRGPFGGGMVGQKSQTFWPSTKRLLGRMRPDRLKAIFTVLLAVVSVAFSVVAPKILGHGTDLIFAGLFGRNIPEGVTQQQFADQVRDRGDSRLADLIEHLDHVVPGQGVDFTALAGVLGLVLAVYVASSMAAFIQAYLLNDVVQGTVYRMREEVEEKINRLPLSYFDRQPRGELLSRVTNDLSLIHI